MTTTTPESDTARAMREAHERRIAMGVSIPAKIEGPVNRPAPRERRHSVRHRAIR
jgi:hypothetical protein